MAFSPPKFVLAIATPELSPAGGTNNLFIFWWNLFMEYNVKLNKYI